MKNIIFVCSGNTCRSPMAEAIAKSLCNNQDLNIISRGMFVYNSLPINENAKIILKNNNIDISSHISKPLTLSEFESADLILTMEQEQKALLIEFSRANNIKKNNIFTLYEYTVNKDTDIKDPFGSNLTTYQLCFDEIYSLVSKINFNKI